MLAGMLQGLPCRSQDGQERYEEVVKGNLSGINRERQIIEESLEVKTENKKKGLLATIWESMTRTGGCCGGGENCCGPTAEDDKKNNEDETVDEPAKQE